MGANPEYPIAAQDTGRVIRPASPDDAEPAAELIYLPMGRLADYLFGFDDPDRARAVLERLFRLEKNRFSHQFSDAAVHRDEVAGLLLAYPARVLPRLKLPMARQLVSILGSISFVRFILRTVKLMRVREVEPDEFYIFTLSVRPEHQDQGIGSRLLEHAEVRTRSAGLENVSLGVTTDNEPAIHFYEKHGFRIVDTVVIPWLEQRIGYPGYHRMLKVLPHG